jgi:hypothetical protein
VTPPLEELAALTRYYRFLQGLKLVPAGASMALAGAALARWPAAQQRGGPVQLWALAAALAGFAGYWAFWLYYRRRFGAVREEPSVQRRSTRLIVLATLAGGALGVVTALPAIAQGPWAGGLFALFYSGVLLFYWDWSGRFLGHYPLVAALLAAAAAASGLCAAPLAPSPELAAAVGRGLGVCAVGLATLTVGLLDHRWLAARLRAPPADEGDDVEEGGDAGPV